MEIYGSFTDKKLIRNIFAWPALENQENYLQLTFRELNYSFAIYLWDAIQILQYFFPLLR